MKEKIYKLIFNEFLNLEWIRIRVSKILYIDTRSRIFRTEPTKKGWAPQYTFLRMNES